MKIAKYITELTVIDPDTNLPVEISFYKDMESKAIFGIDSSYILLTDLENIKSPFSASILTIVGD